MTGNRAFGDIEPILRLDRADRQRARRCLDAASGAQPAGEHGLGQRDRRGMITRGAQDRGRLDHARSAFGENVGIARLFDRSPQPAGPNAAFSGSSRDFGRNEIAKEPHRAVVEDRVRHREPHLTAGRGRGR